MASAGAANLRGKTGRRFRNGDHDRSLTTSPRGSVCRPGLVSGRLEMKKEDGSKHKSSIKWSTPSFEECGAKK